MAFSLKFLKFYKVVFIRPTWAVKRGVQSTSLLLKMKTKPVDKISHVPKSKWKTIEAVPVWKNITLKQLAGALGKDVDHVLEVMTFVDNSVKYRKPDDIVDDWKVVQEVVKKSGKRVKIVSEPKDEVQEEFQDVEKRKPCEYIDVRKRHPVVTIMGHVDHGKTTLLDNLRQSSIVKSEFGGITQHIGAFNVSVGKDKITFLDTPGHAAFCSMRNRGAQCTDIVVLVVASDDGVMEQTVESINMAKAANVPIIVAINKIDKPKADIEKTKQMLVQHGVQVEDCGGDVQVVNISALKGTNVNTLIEAILVQAELMELRSDIAGKVEGTIIESTKDPLRGKLCTVLVTCGTLKKGCILVAGTAWCKVRAMFDESSKPLQEAPPSTPVQILGWKELPSPGDTTIEVTSEKRATEIVHHRAELNSRKKIEEDKEVIERKAEEHNTKYKALLEEKRRLGRFKLKRSGPRQKEIQNDNGQRLNIIVKADVDGSLEAILDTLETYDSQLCKLDVVHFGVGPVSKNDVTLADAFNALIYAFNTSILPDAGKCQIKHINVIYRLVEDIKKEINKRLPYKEVEEVIGEANVLQEFVINEGKSKVPVAGCRCVKGLLKKSGKYKLIRSNETIFDGSLVSLRHLKNEVDVIKKDLECGLRLSDSTIHVQPGDTIICYRVNKVPQTVDWDPGFSLPS